MAISKIHYENKEKTQDDPDKPRKNKVTDEDLNEIKEIVNNNADELINAQNALIEDEKNIKQLQTDNTQNKKDISNIKTEQTEQNNRLSDLEVDNTNQKSDIKNLKEDVDELYKDNTINKQEISKLKSVLGVETEEAKSLHVENADIIGNLKIKGNIEKDGEASLSNPVYLNTLGSNADGSFKGSTEIKISNGTDTKSFVLPIQKEMLTEDYFVKESDGWKEVHNWTKIIFDGTENWTVSFNIPGSTHKGNPYFVKIEREAIYDENQYCSHCSKCSYKGEEEGSFAATQNYFYFNPDDSEIASLSGLKDWLVQQNNNGTPLTAWYKCEEYKIACTDEQTTILDQLSNLDLYKGVNNITTTENIALLKLYYVTDIKSEQAQQNMNIENLQKENTELKEECSRLRQDLNAFPSGQAEGEYITLKDSADSRFNMFRVGGNSKQETRSGKNMINVIAGSGTVHGITFTNNKDGSITLNGTNTSGGTLYFNLNNNAENYFNLTKGNTYGLLLKNTVSGLNLTVRTVSKNYPIISTGNVVEEIVEEYSEETDNEGYAYISIYANTTINNVTVYPMLVEGSEIGEWEPYGAMPSPEYPSEIRNNVENINIINCNENLVLNGYSTDKTDKAFWKEKSAGFTPLSDGWGRFEANNSNGNSVKYVNAFISFEKFKKIINKNNAYKLLVEFRNVNMPSSSSNNYICICTGSDVEPFRETVKYNASEITQNLRFSATLNPSKAENPSYLLRSFFAVPAGNTSSLEVRISLLEYDSTETEIKIGNQELTFPLEEGQRLMLGDYLADDGIHHKRKQYEFDGTESFTRYRNYPNSYGYRFNLSGVKANTNVLCTKYKYTPFSDFYNEETDVAGEVTTYNSSDNLIYFGSSKATVEEFKEEIKGSILEYEMLEEEIEPYTEEQKKVYDQIVQTAKSYKNVTNIYSPDPVSPVFSVNYRKDIETILEQVQAQTNEIKELLSTTKTSATLLDNLQNDLESEVM